MLAVDEPGSIPARAGWTLPPAGVAAFSVSGGRTMSFFRLVRADDHCQFRHASVGCRGNRGTVVCPVSASLRPSGHSRTTLAVTRSFVSTTPFGHSVMMWSGWSSSWYTHGFPCSKQMSRLSSTRWSRFSILGSRWGVLCVPRCSCCRRRAGRWRFDRSVILRHGASVVSLW